MKTYPKGLKAYEAPELIDNSSGRSHLEGIAEETLSKICDFEASENRTIGIEKNPENLKELIGNDIRESVPPRIYSIISNIVSLIEDLESKK